MEMLFTDFRKRFNLTVYEVHKLDKAGIVKIFQGGYPGHSMCHPKKIRVENLKQLEKYCAWSKHVEDPEYDGYEQAPFPSVGSLIEKNLIEKKHRASPNNPRPKKLRNYMWGEFGEPIRSLWVINEYKRKA